METIKEEFDKLSRELEIKKAFREEQRKKRARKLEIQWFTSTAGGMASADKKKKKAEPDKGFIYCPYIPKMKTVKKT